MHKKDIRVLVVEKSRSAAASLFADLIAKDLDILNYGAIDEARDLTFIIDKLAEYADGVFVVNAASMRDAESQLRDLYGVAVALSDFTHIYVTRNGEVDIFKYGATARRIFT